MREREPVARRLAGQRGFSLAEGLICIAIASGGVIAVSGAVANGMRTSATAAEREQLTSDALNVLADLRIATAYDAKLLAASAGSAGPVGPTGPGGGSGTRSRRVVDLPKAGGGTRTVTFDVALTPGGVSARPVYTAEVTATAADGTSVSERRYLVNEAPPPGATIDTDGNVVDPEATP